MVYASFSAPLDSCPVPEKNRSHGVAPVAPAAVGGEAIVVGIARLLPWRGGLVVVSRELSSPERFRVSGPPPGEQVNRSVPYCRLRRRSLCIRSFGGRAALRGAQSP